MEAANREFSENIGRLTSNIEKCTNSVIDVFVLIRQSMAQTPFAAPPPPHNSSHHQHYGYLYAPAVSAFSSAATRPTPPQHHKDAAPFSHTEYLYSNDRE
ncbi:hypothetical protein QQF64_023694 [Cirrhinus molitorella]|uniref:Uncharacterized protein n=1 Tax=Cirrhinus molitorella TaxID=172907 RepID=A0ABR3NJQ2_9TELE